MSAHLVIRGQARPLRLDPICAAFGAPIAAKVGLSISVLGMLWLQAAFIISSLRIHASERQTQSYMLHAISIMIERPEANIPALIGSWKWVETG